MGIIKREEWGLEEGRISIRWGKNEDRKREKEYKKGNKCE